MNKQTKDLVEHIFGTMIYSHYQRQFNELVDLVREAERNECAEICSDLFMSDGAGGGLPTLCTSAPLLAQTIQLLLGNLHYVALSAVSRNRG